MKKKHIIIYTPTSKDGDPNMDGTIYNSYTNRMAISFFWISNPCARLDGWKKLILHQLQQIMLVSFEIYIRKLIIRIEGWFWSFNEGMNGITDAHIFVWRAYVRIGYSIRTFIKRLKTTFNS